MFTKKLNKALSTSLAVAVLATGFSFSVNQAQAGDYRHYEKRNYNHNYHRHERRNYGRDLAIGFGLAIVKKAIEQKRAQQQDDYYDEEQEDPNLNRRYYGSRQAIVKRAKREGWTRRNRRSYNCAMVEEWKKLVKAAKEALRRDKAMQKKYPNYDNSRSIEFSEKELERRKKELKRARKRCKARR